MSALVAIAAPAPLEPESAAVVHAAGCATVAMPVVLPLERLCQSCWAQARRTITGGPLAGVLSLYCSRSCSNREADERRADREVRGVKRRRGSLSTSARKRRAEAQARLT